MRPETGYTKEMVAKMDEIADDIRRVRVEDKLELCHVLGDDAFGPQSAQQYHLFEDVPRSWIISRSYNALFG